MAQTPEQGGFAEKFKIYNKYIVCSQCTELGCYQSEGINGTGRRFTCVGSFVNEEGRSVKCNNHIQEAAMDALLDQVIANLNSTNNTNNTSNSNNSNSSNVSSAGSSSRPGSSTIHPATTTTVLTVSTATYDDCGSLLPKVHPGTTSARHAFMDQRILSDVHIIQTYKDINMPLETLKGGLFYLRLDLFPAWLRSHSMSTGINLYFSSACSRDGTNKRCDDFSKLLEVFPPGTKFSMTHRCEHYNLWPEVTKEDVKANAGKPRKIYGPEYPPGKTFRQSASVGYGCHGSISSDVEWVRMVNNGPLIGLCTVNYDYCYKPALGIRRRMYLVRTKAAAEAPPPSRNYNGSMSGFGGVFGLWGSGSDSDSDVGSEFGVDVDDFSMWDTSLQTEASRRISGGIAESLASRRPGLELTAASSSSSSSSSSTRRQQPSTSTPTSTTISTSITTSPSVTSSLMALLTAHGLSPSTIPEAVLLEFVRLTSIGVTISPSMLALSAKLLSKNSASMSEPSSTSSSSAGPSTIIPTTGAPTPSSCSRLPTSPASLSSVMSLPSAATHTSAAHQQTSAPTLTSTPSVPPSLVTQLAEYGLTPASIPSTVLTRFTMMISAGIPISPGVMEFLRKKLSAVGSTAPPRTGAASLSGPGASPSGPAASPSGPAASPSGPTASPSEPAASPSEPAASPSGSVASPSLTGPSTLSTPYSTTNIPQPTSTTNPTSSVPLSLVTLLATNGLQPSSVHPAILSEFVRMTTSEIPIPDSIIKMCVVLDKEALKAAKAASSISSAPSMLTSSAGSSTEAGSSMSGLSNSSAQPSSLKSSVTASSKMPAPAGSSAPMTIAAAQTPLPTPRTHVVSLSTAQQPIVIEDDDDPAEEAIEHIVHVMAAGPTISIKVQGMVDEVVDTIDSLVRMATVEASIYSRKRRRTK